MSTAASWQMQAFRNESPSVGGKGGAAGRIWAWISSATDAAWKSDCRGTLLDAIAPSRADSDRGKVLALKSDDKDDIELITVSSDSGTGSLFITATELTGTADAIIGTPSDALTAYDDGQVVYFEAEGTNTGATTINISSLGSKTVVREDGDALEAGDIENGDLVHLRL